MKNILNLFGFSLGISDSKENISLQNIDSDKEGEKWENLLSRKYITIKDSDIYCNMSFVIKKVSYSQKLRLVCESKTSNFEIIMVLSTPIQISKRGVISAMGIFAGKKKNLLI